MSVLNAATGWLLFAGIMLAVGCLVTRSAILPRAGNAAGVVYPGHLHQPVAVARLGRWAAMVVIVALALAFLRQLLEFRDPFAPLGEDVRLLLSSAWGRSWLWTLPAGALAMAGFWAAGAGRRGGWWVAAAATLVVSAYPALTGHAAGEEGALGVAALAADTLHVLSAGAWMGGLAVVLLLEWRHRRGTPNPEPTSLLPSLVPAFSPIAVTAVGVLMATGVFASWLHLEALSALWATPYGRLLSLKLVVVAAVLALGAVNWRRLTPRLDQDRGQAAMRRAALLELTLANLVLLVTAVLVRTSPMGH